MRIETRRLVLRYWRKGDIDDLVEGLNDLRVSRWLALVPYPYTRKDAASWVRRCEGTATRSGPRASHDFAIEVKATGKVIGGTSLDRIQELHGTAGGGIWISASCHGMGYGSEAYGARSRFAFEDLGLRRLESGYFKGNAASSRMHARLGFRKEGLRVQALFCRAEKRHKDEVMLALLRQDWARGGRRRP
ncbi:MAG TPA: GNAT family protein [Opitutaceae bacterium]|jgi:RimJ/RimL family protein N-acetyltransferase